MPKARCNSSPIIPRSMRPMRSARFSSRSAVSNGWSMPNVPSPAPTKCSPISPALRIASPSPILASSPSMGNAFLRVTLGRTEHLERIPILHEAKRLPTVLTPEEIARLLAAAPGMKYRRRLERGLWRWPALLRGDLAQGIGYRQPPNDDPCRAGQGSQGSHRQALAAFARTVAQLVEGSAAAGRAVPEPDERKKRSATE